MVQANQIMVSRRHPFHGNNPVPLSEFITSSSTFQNGPKYPSNYQYNIYNPAWNSTVPPHKLQGKHRKRKCRRCWCQPDEDHIISEFLESSSIHGIKYVSEPKKHLLERLFWLGAFIASLVMAIYMILDVWNRYYDNPVIVTFSPTEAGIGSIPFPAVTICNINPFSRAKVEEYQRIYETSADASARENALDALRLINGICSAQPSFLKGLDYAKSRGEMPNPEFSKPPSGEGQRKLNQFLLDNGQPCHELLRICVWGQENKKCEEMFKPVITDYGRCCSFNMLPLGLMEYNHHHEFGSTPGPSQWSENETLEWKRWHYKDGFQVDPHKHLKYPYRQRREGNMNGLSVLIDPDVENNFCPLTDSTGIKIMYHLPVDAPRVADLGLIVGLDREIFVELHPDLTIADEEIRGISPQKRKCYFGQEYKLDHYKPYTRSNCLQECWSKNLMDNCSCVLYYAPHNGTIDVCSTSPNTRHSKCIKRVEGQLVAHPHKFCGHCLYSCNYLDYISEVTYAQLQSRDALWGDGFNNTEVPWASKSVSIVHIYMGTGSTVPKLRSKLYQAVDLIANTGGLLGLYIGFSVLSGVEIIYFVTMRLFCKHFRKSREYGHPDETSSRVGQTNPTSQHVQTSPYPYRFGIANHPFLQESKTGNQMY